MVLLLGIGVMVYAGAQIAETQHIYQEGSTAYNDLSIQVKKSAPINFGESPTQQSDTDTEISHEIKGTSQSREMQIYIPDFDIDFDMLKAINKDTAAWLYSPGTVIDYPVMEADDYNYYLYHLPDGTRNANGSLFIDYNCASDFSDRLTVIYGHHMKTGDMMFGSLKGYKNQEYYKEHPFMYLYTEKENYRIDILYGFVISAGQWREKAFMYEENLGAFLDYAIRNTTFKSEAKYEEGDKIVALSTCSYEFDDARYVVLGVLKTNEN